MTSTSPRHSAEPGPDDNRLKSEGSSVAKTVRPGSRHPWLFRMAAILFPFVFLVVVELVLRLTGCFADENTMWQSRYVEFEKGTWFSPVWSNHVPMPKPAGTFRIFALGGSTAFGFGVEHAYPDLLATALNSRGGGRRFEVLNAGVPAAGSHRLFEILKEAAEFDPDVVLVNLGHNEFIEDIFFAPDSFLAKQQRLREFAGQFRIIRGLARVFNVSDRLNGSFHRARLQHHFIGRKQFPLIRTPEQYRTRLAFLESNLDLMVAFAREHHFPVILMPEAANLMAPPGDAVHGAGFRQPDPWSAFMAEGRDRLEKGDADAALAALRKAEALDPNYAMTRFEIARCLIAKGDLLAARRELDLANADDRRGDRINPDIFKIMAGVAARTGTPLLDLKEDLYGQPVDAFGPFGQKLFLDHCHPTEEGHRIMTRSILRFLEEQKLIPALSGR